VIWLLLVLGFTVGERLEYEARFSFLNLGTMTLEVRDTIDYNGVPCYHIRSVLTSASGLRLLFSIDDTVEVYTSRDRLLPHLYRERINESGYRRASDIYYDRDSNRVAARDDSTHMSITDETRDLLSFWYYLRTVPLIEGDTFTVDIHSAGENHSIECRVERSERVKTGRGEVEAVRVSPGTKGKGIFGARGGMDMWYSVDGRLPVQIRASMKMGSVLFRLKGVND
jgi:hypothetical protein